MPSITKPTMQPRIDSSPILLLIFEFLEPLPLAVLARLRLPPTIRPHAGAAPRKPPASCQKSMGLQHQVQQAHKKHIRSDTNDPARSAIPPLPTSPTASHFGPLEIGARLRTLSSSVKNKLRMQQIQFSAAAERYGFSSAPGMTFLSGAESSCSSSGWGIGLRGSI